MLTLNHRFSDNRAVLTGDYLIYEVIGRCLSLAHNLRIIDLVVDTAREMVAGVLMEQSVLAAEPTLGEYLAMARSKTGSLFGLAFGLPFVVDPRLEDARECGAIFGTVFQIHDDRLDRDQDLSHENIFHICSPAEIEGILADQTGRLFAAGRKIGIESTLLDVIAYLKTYGYFPEVGKGRPRGRRLPRSSGA